MARIVENNKGFKVIVINNIEASQLEFGSPIQVCLCTFCNNIIKDEIYYIPMLNDCMCKDCYNEWLKNAVYYKEDAEFEERYFNYYAKQLGLI